MIKINNLLDKKYSVLDYGFIIPIDYMGTDSSICESARISYGEGTKSTKDDEKLIRYMYRHNHLSPFEMCSVKIHLRLPIVVMRQLIRHRTFKINEMSGRYSIMPKEVLQTNPFKWRLQSANNKQGSDGFLVSDRGIKLTDKEHSLHEHARQVYSDRLEEGVAREQARKDLPLSTYTEIYLCADLRNLLHFLSLRMDSHAQFEIRQYANIIGNEIVAKLFPITWKAFNDYHPMRSALTLTALDIQIIKRGLVAAEEFGWIKYSKKASECPCCKGEGKLSIPLDGRIIEVLSKCICDGTGKLYRLKRNRERQECAEKLEVLGIDIPWARHSNEF